MKTKSDLHLFSLFVSLGMGQEKDLTASMLGRILSTTLKKVLYWFFNIFHLLLNIFLFLKFNYIRVCISYKIHLLIKKAVERKTFNSFFIINDISELHLQTYHPIGQLLQISGQVLVKCVLHLEFAY